MARCRITNPKKLRKVALLLGRTPQIVFYRGGQSDRVLGHYFSVYCSDGTAWYVSSKLDRFERDEDPPAAASAADGTEWKRA